MLSLYKRKSKTKNLGRPSITRREYLVGINAPSNYEDRGEDTYISIKQEELFKDINFEIGEGVGFKKTEASLFKSFNKFYSYGLGDSYIVSQKPHKIFNFAFHQLVNYSIIYSFKSFFRFQLPEGFVIFFWGITRFIGMINGLINLILKKLKV